MQNNLFHRLGLIFLLCGLLTPGVAHALFRGDEFTPREYSIARLYFINRTSYELPFIFSDRFGSATNAFVAAAGSLSGSELYLYQNLKVQQQIGSAYYLRANYLRDTDFDGHYQRFSIGLARQFGERWLVEILGEPTPNKEAADMGGALSFHGNRADMRLTVIRPLFVYEDKNPDEATIETEPVNVQLETAYRIGQSLELFVRADLDFASEILNPQQSFAFRFEKYQAGGGFRWHFCERSHFGATLDAEHSKQERLGLAPEDPKAFAVERDYLSVQVEWFRRLPKEAHLRIGGRYVFLDEDLQYFDAPLDSLHIDREDHIVYVGHTWAVRPNVHLHSMGLIDYLNDRRVSLLQETNRDDQLFLARATGSIIFSGDRYMVEGGLGLTIVSPRFGGGFIRAFMEF